MAKKSDAGSQRNLFVAQPMMQATDHQVPLLTMHQRFSNEKIKLPPFQRDFLWSDEKVKGWAAGIMKGNPVGVIVTYQLTDENTDDHPVYLNDGRQRLGATQKILEHPQRYNMPGREQAEAFIEAFSITVQHRYYKDHQEALEAFQNLNKGTQVTPADFYKGELTQYSSGKRIYEEIPRIVTQVEAHLLKKPQNPNYDRLCIRRRDALALFYQYVSGTDTTHFWGVASSKVKEGKEKYQPVERVLVSYIKDGHDKDIDSQLASFQKYLEQQTALIEETLHDLKGRGVAISPTLYRHLVHVAIYRKNTGRSVEWEAQYLRAVIANSNNLNSIISIPATDTRPASYCNLSLQDLNQMGVVCRTFGIAIEKPKRKKKGGAAPGWDNSHVLPFSVDGDGPTIPEPAPLNRARGAKPMHREPNEKGD